MQHNLKLTFDQPTTATKNMFPTKKELLTLRSNHQISKTYHAIKEDALIDQLCSEVAYALLTSDKITIDEALVIYSSNDRLYRNSDQIRPKFGDGVTHVSRRNLILEKIDAKINALPKPLANQVKMYSQLENSIMPALTYKLKNKAVIKLKHAGYRISGD